MDASLNPPPRSKNNWRELIQKMSEISTSSYRKYLNQSQDFIRYFKRLLHINHLESLQLDQDQPKERMLIIFKV